MNSTKTLTGLTLLLFSLFLSISLQAQRTLRELPHSFRPSPGDLPGLVAQQVPSLDMAKVIREDKANPGSVRFAAPLKVRYDLQSSGRWSELANGDRLWRLQLRVPDAKGLYVVYEDFFLPKGGRLFVYSPDKKQLLGAYSAQNNTKSGRFLTGIIKGEEVVLEYFEPAAVKGQGRIQVGRLYQAYNLDHLTPSDYPFQVHEGTDGFGESASCHVNVNCSQGDSWQDHKRAVVRILRIFDEGIGYCSGTLINNVRQDGTPYLLSAYHCFAGFTPQLDLWRFDFNYEGTGCDNPASEPSFASILGCEYVSGREESDFLLLKLLRGVPSIVNPYFMGWNRDSVALSQKTTGIHHPQGDIKKISVDDQPTQIYQQSIIWNNNVTTPPNHHFLVNFDDGSFENGSSGSAMIDHNGLIVGQLHGGVANCVQRRAFYGRFSKSWNAGGNPDERLREWLDPDGTGAMTLGHYQPPPDYTLSGTVKMPDDRPINGVTIYLSGDLADSLTTGPDGTFSFDVPSGGSYTLTAVKRDNAKNGVSSFDLVFVSKHVLDVEALPSPYGILAADVSMNGTISGFDMVLISKLVLGVDSGFPSGLSWRFENDGVQVLNNLSEDRTDLEFIGVKLGDLSGNADPAE
ncbi:MAG: carboxypeptidase regulatory-like domain-containing protein [Bacteroidota bacterium]